MQANSGDPDQTPHSVVSDLGLHYLPMSHKKDVRHIWVKMHLFYLSHKLQKFGKYIVEIIFLGTSDFASVNITVLGLTNPDVYLKRMHQLYNVRATVYQIAYPMILKLQLEICLEIGHDFKLL